VKTAPNYWHNKPGQRLRHFFLVHLIRFLPWWKTGHVQQTLFSCDVSFNQPIWCLGQSCPRIYQAKRLRIVLRLSSQCSFPIMRTWISNLFQVVPNRFGLPNTTSLVFFGFLNISSRHRLFRNLYEGGDIGEGIVK
jgi:hypothetical protein